MQEQKRSKCPFTLSSPKWSWHFPPAPNGLHILSNAQIRFIINVIRSETASWMCTALFGAVAQPSWSITRREACQIMVWLLSFSSGAGRVPEQKTCHVPVWPAGRWVTVFGLRHLWTRLHPGNAGRFITRWCKSRSTPPKTPGVHCWLMSCLAWNPWIIFFKGRFPSLATVLV